MRIVGGLLRGRPIVAPKGHSIRPTAERARQAIFNVLEHAEFSRPLAGLRAVDLFAGSGAMGLEALSRGAASCLFVDADPAALAAISRNVAALGVGERASIQAGDATRMGAGESFDLAFVDPPYGAGLAQTALTGLAGRLAAGALAVVERGADEGPLAAPGYAVLAERTWGAARVGFVEFIGGRTGVRCRRA
ncbi:MAG: RsmD family RNA methyltransferase [Caulobacteraceae bacterium]